MARGDLIVFNEALAFMVDGGFEAADNIWIGLVTNSPAPTQTDTTPAFTDYTQCTPGGNYADGGELLDTLGNMVTQSSNVMTFDDTGASVTWGIHASNPTNAYYAIVYNYTQAGKEALCYIDLGGPINMTLGDLTITWNGSGIFTITN